MTDCTNEMNETDDMSGDGGDTPTKRLNLNNIAGVRRELARLYRDARSGIVESQDASRMANMLNILAGLIERSDFEQRIAALEEKSK